MLDAETIGTRAARPLGTRFGTDGKINSNPTCTPREQPRSSHFAMVGLLGWVSMCEMVVGLQLLPGRHGQGLVHLPRFFSCEASSLSVMLILLAYWGYWRASGCCNGYLTYMLPYVPTQPQLYFLLFFFFPSLLLSIISIINSRSLSAQAVVTGVFSLSFPPAVYFIAQREGSAFPLLLDAFMELCYLTLSRFSAYVCMYVFYRPRLLIPAVNMTEGL